MKKLPLSFSPSGGNVHLGNVCNRLPHFAAAETFDALPFVSMIPAFQCPELVWHPGVGLNDLLQT
jgi:hypothetical protein